MKKYKKILFLFLIIVVTILGIFLYTTVSKENIGTVMYFVLRKYQEVPVNE